MALFLPSGSSSTSVPSSERSSAYTKSSGTGVFARFPVAAAFGAFIDSRTSVVDARPTHNPGFATRKIPLARRRSKGERQRRTKARSWTSSTVPKWSQCALLGEFMPRRPTACLARRQRLATVATMAVAQVLVVDDEPSILTTLKTALRLEGYAVDVAGGVQLAEERATKKSYDLILLDVAL